ncbi:Solute carrier family 22 member 8 [Chionoecetes opilio]|uniref:Solute carrier family 22 member 8 n=1 Tax=Chionoecetes opilio TaxID=41210 RepID=A0A8J5C9Y5_CHIOP|nr:Solute carrier family 22 member 8 [Chionoecetes opilio]
MSGSTNKFDGLLTRLGTGRWNLLFFVAVSYWNMHLASNTLSGAYVAPVVKHTCRPPPTGYTLTTTTTAQGNNHTTEDHCHYLVNSTEGGGFDSVPCDAWHYDTTTFAFTLTSQFDLVCSSEYLRATYQSLYMFGTLFGAPINGLLSDRFGRKTTLTFGVLTYFALAMASSWLPTLAAVFAFRFVLGFLHPTVIQTGYILALEVCEPRYRSLLGIMISLPWAVGTMAWGGVAYLIRDWRWLQLVVNIPSLFMLPALWFLDESPRWLIVHGEFDKAREVLTRASKWNRVSLPPPDELDSLMCTIQREARVGQRATQEGRGEEGEGGYKRKAWKIVLRLMILFRTPRLRLVTIILSLKFFLVSLIFYGMSLNAVNYSADPFLYMALSGVVEVPAYTLTAPIVAKFGRKGPSIAYYFVSGVVILAVAFIPAGHRWVVMVLALTGRMCISAAFQVLYLYSVELFPTEVRLQGLGSATIVSRLGSMISPFVTELLGPIYPSAPSLVFGVGAFIACLATLPLWETLGHALPDTITDLEEGDARRPSVAARDAEADEETEMAKLPTVSWSSRVTDPLTLILEAPRCAAPAEPSELRWICQWNFSVSFSINK